MGPPKKGQREWKKTCLISLMSLTGVGGGDSLGEDAVGDGAQHAEGEHQRQGNDAVMPHGPHQGLSDKTRGTTDH